MFDDHWSKGGVAWGAPSSSGKFYKGPSMDTPWNNDLLTKLNCIAELKVLGMKTENGHWKMGTFYDSGGDTKSNLRARPNYKARKLIQQQQAPKVMARKRRLALKRRNALAQAQLAAKRAALRGEPTPPETIKILQKIKQKQVEEQKKNLERLQRMRRNKISVPATTLKPSSVEAKLSAKKTQKTQKKTKKQRSLPELSKERPYSPTPETSRSHLPLLPTWRTSDEQLINAIETRMKDLVTTNKIDLLKAVEERLMKLERNIAGGLKQIKNIQRHANTIGNINEEKAKMQSLKHDVEFRRMNKFYENVSKLQNDCMTNINKSKKC